MKKGLFGDLPEEKRTKVDKNEKKKEVVAIEVEEEKKPTQKKKKKIPSLAETIQKLQKYMLVDKKCSRAAGLFATLMENELKAKTIDLFFEAFFQVMKKDFLTSLNDSIINSSECRSSFHRIVTLFQEKKHFLHPENQLPFLYNWELTAIVHNNLFTDDTYQFSKNTKLVKLELEKIIKADEQSREPLTADDKDYSVEVLGRQKTKIIMQCLATLNRMHSVEWAKIPAESALNLATFNRHLFPSIYREKIDSYTSSIRKRKNAPGFLRSAASEKRRNVVIATSKRNEATGNTEISQAGIKVGSTNHPLFNINR